MGEIPTGQWTWMERGEAHCFTAVFVIQSFQIASVWSFRAAALVSIKVCQGPRTQCLWFQVRTHGSFGADMQCPTDDCESPSPRGLAPRTRS